MTSLPSIRDLLQELGSFCDSSICPSLTPLARSQTVDMISSPPRAFSPNMSAPFRVSRQTPDVHITGQNGDLRLWTSPVSQEGSSNVDCSGSETSSMMHHNLETNTSSESALCLEPVKAFRASENQQTSPRQTSSWFRPESPVVVATMERVKHLSRDQLYDQFWFRAPNRSAYGSHPNSRNPEGVLMPSDHCARKSKHWSSKQNHRCVEKMRRIRHRVYQGDLHVMTCEKANLLAEHDTIYGAYKVGGKRRKRAAANASTPGKDDQLIANIYMQVLSALVARSEHEGRKQAENRVRELEQELLALSALI